MKNSAKFVLTLVLTAASAASCLKETVVQGVDSGELTLNPRVNVLTKAPIPGRAFPEDRTIVLSAYCTDDSYTREFFRGITFKREEAKNSWTGGGGSNPKYWPVTGTLDLLAYSADGFSPALTPVYNVDNCSADVTLTVSDNNAAQVDILWAGISGYDHRTDGDTLHMTFKHAEASVAFNAKSVVPYDSAANMGITIDNITLNSVKSSGTVKLPGTGDCIWNVQDTPKSNIELPGIPTTGYNVTDTLIDLTAKPFAIGDTGIIVIPQTATSFKVNYTVHYGRDVLTLPVDKSETFTHTISSSWEAGTKYVYNMEFKLDEILVATDIYDWTESSSGMPVQEPVSATFKREDGDRSIDLGAAKLSAGGVVGIDWGFGRRQIIENTSTSAEMTILELPHTYYAEPDSVKIHVRKGELNFGTVPNTQYKRFHVYNTNEVKIQLALQYTLRLNTVEHGEVKLIHPDGIVTKVAPQQQVYGGETVQVTTTPDSLYVLDKITYDFNSSSHDISETPYFVMPPSYTSVTVSFKLNKYHIETKDVSITGASFKVTKGGNMVTEATYGDSLKVQATCPNGYKVDKITVCKTGDTSTTFPVADGSFTMPGCGVTVEVDFKPDESSGGSTELTPGGLI